VLEELNSTNLELSFKENEEYKEIYQKLQAILKYYENLLPKLDILSEKIYEYRWINIDLKVEIIKDFISVKENNLYIIKQIQSILGIQNSNYSIYLKYFEKMIGFLLPKITEQTVHINKITSSISSIKTQDIKEIINTLNSFMDNMVKISSLITKIQEKSIHLKNKFENKNMTPKKEIYKKEYKLNVNKKLIILNVFTKFDEKIYEAIKIICPNEEAIYSLFECIKNTTEHILINNDYFIRSSKCIINIQIILFDNPNCMASYLLNMSSDNIINLQLSLLHLIKEENKLKKDEKIFSLNSEIYTSLAHELGHSYDYQLNKISNYHYIYNEHKILSDIRSEGLARFIEIVVKNGITKLNPYEKFTSDIYNKINELFINNYDLKMVNQAKDLGFLHDLGYHVTKVIFFFDFKDFFLNNYNKDSNIKFPEKDKLDLFIKKISLMDIKKFFERYIEASKFLKIEPNEFIINLIKKTSL
jgi:hypothetical protein